MLNYKIIEFNNCDHLTGLDDSIICAGFQNERLIERNYYYVEYTPLS